MHADLGRENCRVRWLAMHCALQTARTGKALATCNLSNILVKLQDNIACLIHAVWSLLDTYSAAGEFKRHLAAAREMSGAVDDNATLSMRRYRPWLDPAIKMEGSEASSPRSDLASGGSCWS